MISKKEVKHIAKLARLKLTEKEIIKMQKELSTILDYFNLLKEVEVRHSSLIQKKKGKPKNHFFLKNIVREDIIKKQPLERVNKLFEAAPKKEKGYVKVKAVF